MEEAEQGQVKQMAVIEELYLKKDRACKDGERGYSEDRGYAGCTLCDRLDLLLKRVMDALGEDWLNFD